jgi:hypothetical protein
VCAERECVSLLSALVKREARAIDNAQAAPRGPGLVFTSLQLRAASSELACCAGPGLPPARPTGALRALAAMIDK